MRDGVSGWPLKVMGGSAFGRRMAALGLGFGLSWERSTAWLALEVVEVESYEIGRAIK